MADHILYHESKKLNTRLDSMLSSGEPYLLIDITLEEKGQYKFLGDHKFGHGSQLLLERNIL